MTTLSCKANADYYAIICDKVTNNIVIPKKMDKIDTENIIIPKYNEYNLLLKNNYNLQQLKMISKAYKLKISGNKQQIIHRIYSYLYLSWKIVKIQSLVRGHIHRQYILSHGPGFKNRTLCTNNFDFLSMDDLTSIPNEQFFSFKDDDGFIYGFDIMSIHNLIYKCNGLVKNPFNNKLLTSNIIDEYRYLLRLSRLLKINVTTEITDVTKEVSDKKSVELRALSLFQFIDSLGNYSNANWFLSLNRTQLTKYLRELIDIWKYRANLSLEMKRAICHPFGNPFNTLPSSQYIINLQDMDLFRKIILDVMEKMVTCGIDKDSKCLGAFYVLGALTLVNTDASTSLPWLYEAAYYM